MKFLVCIFLFTFCLFTEAQSVGPNDLKERILKITLPQLEGISFKI